MSRRLSVLGGLFLLLLVLLLAFPPSDERQPPLTVYSAEPGGGKALRLWLEALGYPVTTLEGEPYQVGSEVSVTLVLEPTRWIDREQASILEQWARRGGRLVVADSGFRTSELLGRFDVSVRLLDEEMTSAVPAPGGRLDPSIRPLRVTARTELVGRSGAMPLLLGEPRDDPGAEIVAAGAPPTAGVRARAAGLTGLSANGSTALSASGSAASSARQAPILGLRVPAGRGELLVLTVPDLLSNAGLHDESSARLALSLVGPPGRGTVAFDEFHHGFGAIRNRSVYALLLEQAWGRTIFLAAGLVLLFLLWRGRRFGRAVPVFVDRGRSLGELVTSQAALYRAGGKCAFAAAHLERQLRHDVAQAVGLPADASDEQIADHARALGRDPTPVLRVLAGLGRARSDRELLTLARQGERASAILRRADRTGRDAR